MSQIAISKSGRGGRRKLPWVFTEHGVAMLSSVLRSERAIQVNISIIKTFVRMREMLATNKDLARRVEKHDKDIAILYDYLKKLLDPLNPQNDKLAIYVNRSENNFADVKERPLGYILRWSHSCWSVT